VILSLLYSLSPVYVVVGVGSFPIEFKENAEWEFYELGWVWKVDSGSLPDSDTPTGIVLGLGAKFGGKSPFLNLEAGYVVGTKAKLVYWNTEVDLRGLQVSLLAGFKF